METKYSIADIKKTLHKRVSPTTVFLYNPLSIIPTWIVANFTRITPNQITWLSFLAGLASAWYFFQNHLILGALLYLFGFSLLDAVDGKLARLKGILPPIGGFLDSTLGSVTFSLNILALAIGQFIATNQATFLILGLAILFVHFIMMGLAGAKEVAYIKKEGREGAYGLKEQKLTMDKPESYKFLGKLKNIKDYFERKGFYPRFTGDEVCILILLIGPVFGVVKECLFIAVILYLLTFILHFVVTAIDLYR